MILVLLFMMMRPSLIVNAALSEALVAVGYYVFASLGISFVTDADFRDGMVDWLKYTAKKLGEGYLNFFYDKCSPWVEGIDIIVTFTGEEWNKLRHSIFDWINQNQLMTAIGVVTNDNGIMGFEDNNSFSYIVTDNDISLGRLYFPAPKYGWTYHSNFDCDYMGYNIGGYYPFRDYDLFDQDYYNDNTYYAPWIDIDLGDGLVFYAVLDLGAKYNIGDVKSHFPSACKLVSCTNSRGFPSFLDPVSGTRFDLFLYDYANNSNADMSYFSYYTQAFLCLNNRRLNLDLLTGKFIFADDGTVALDDFDLNDYGGYKNDWRWYIAERMGFALPADIVHDDNYVPDVYVPHTDTDFTIDKDYFPSKSVDDTGQDVYSGDVDDAASVSVHVAGTMEGVKDATKTPDVAQESIDVLAKPADIPDIDSGGLFDKFPFCIPKDIYNIFAGFFTSDREAPKFVFPFKLIKRGDEYLINYNITIDFSILDPVMPLFRLFIDIFFVYGLILITRKVIGAE